SGWNWDWHNRTVDLLSQRGVQIIGLLNRPTPGWANGQRAENVPPDPETFAAFAKEVVTRYKDRVHYWQVWNEPDNPYYWSPRPDPAAYAALLKATYQAIKAADPSAHVLSAGLVSPEPAGEFLRQLQANGAWDSFDILALNPYADPKSPERGQIDTEGVGMVRGLASVFGSKPIWVTEFGWATSPADRTTVQVDEQTQATYLVRSMALLRAAGAERALWYNLKDSDSPSWNLYGLVQYDSSGASYDSSLYKQAYSYFQVLNQQLRDTSVGTLIDLNDLRNVFDFEQAGTWKAIDQRSNGTLTQTNAQAHSGQSAGQLSYSFRTAGNDYVVFSPETGIPIPDGTSKLGIWVYGDGSANIVQARIRDSQGQVLQFRLGPVGAPEWHFISAPITGQVDFPASLDSLILDDDPNSTSGSGTIYLDDLTASVGPESYAVRFMKANEAVDVIWAPDSAQVTLPTSSDHVTRVRAWGETTEEPVSNGHYTFTAGPDPVYIHHVPMR
ncbi:MAG: hypothetical protein HGA19_15085, partial [Oscillochloris sp.]|nr:hypothetical protein [Oscillochloris sp.]